MVYLQLNSPVKYLLYSLTNKRTVTLMILSQATCEQVLNSFQNFLQHIILVLSVPD